MAPPTPQEALLQLDLLIADDDYDSQAARRVLEDALAEKERKIEAYDRARAKVKIEGATRAEYVLLADSSLAENELLREACEKALSLLERTLSLLERPKGRSK